MSYLLILLVLAIAGCSLFNAGQPPYSVVMPGPHANTLWISRDGMTLGYLPALMRDKKENRLYQQYLYIDNPVTSHIDSKMKVMQRVCRLFPEFDPAYPMQVTVPSHKKSLDQQPLLPANPFLPPELPIEKYSLLQGMPALIAMGQFLFTYKPQADFYVLRGISAPDDYVNSPVCRINVSLR